MITGYSPPREISSWFIMLLAVCLLCCDSGVDIRPLGSENDSSCQPPSSDDYILPYPVGTAFELLQGTCGSLDHNLEERYAFDFAMPIGSIVTAAQDGTVLALEEGFRDGENDRTTLNQLLIEHENGTVGRYLHLTQNGALVEVGDFVQRGDTIALSGHTGFIMEPLLHFDVVRCGISCADFVTISVGFLNADPPLKDESVDYLALPY